MAQAAVAQATVAQAVHEDVADEKQISIAVQQGQKRRIMKGMTYDIEEKHGFLYLVRTR